MIRNSEYWDMVTEIENEVKNLVEENKQLKKKVAELTIRNEVKLEANDRVALLEEEVSKLRKLTDVFQNRESKNREKIIQIYRLIEKEVREKHLSMEKTESPPPAKESSPAWPDKNQLNEEIREEESYIPHIEIDDEEERKSVDFQSETKSQETKSIEKESKDNIPVFPKSPNSTSYSPEKDSNKEDTDNDVSSLMINNFADEEDPFGSEDSKVSDDDFFKSELK